MSLSQIPDEQFKIFNSLHKIQYEEAHVLSLLEFALQYLQYSEV